jgi:hypothetical protein
MKGSLLSLVFSPLYSLPCILSLVFSPLYSLLRKDKDKGVAKRIGTKLKWNGKIKGRTRRSGKNKRRSEASYSLRLLQK